MKNIILTLNLIFPFVSLQAITVNSIQELRQSVDPLQNSTAEVLGYYKPGDRGGGSFYWINAGSLATLSDNGGTVIKSEVHSSGRWIRRIQNPFLSILWFGAKANDAIIDSGPIEKALEFANREKHRKVYFPSGLYLIDRPIKISSRKIFGEHFGRPTEHGTIIKAASSFQGEAMIVSSNNHCQILDLIIDADSTVDHAIHLYKANNTTTIVSNVTAINAKQFGFYFQSCQSATFERLFAKGNQVGIVAEDCNASRFTHCQVNFNRSHGIWVKTSGRPSAGCRIRNLISENNQNHGLLAEGVVGLRAEDCWIEANYDDGLRLSKCRNAVITGSRISGGEDSGDRCIRLMDCRSTVVSNSSVEKSQHQDYLQITDLRGLGNELHQSNWRISQHLVQRLPTEILP